MGSTRGGGCHHQQTRGRWGERRRVAWRADGMAERSGGAAMGAANAACADTERVSEQVLPHEAGQCDSGLLSAARGLRQREDRAHCVVPPGFKVRNTKFEVKLISHGNSPTKFEVKLISHGNSPTSSTKFEVKLISHRNPPTSSTKYKTLRTSYVNFGRAEGEIRNTKVAVTQELARRGEVARSATWRGGSAQWGDPTRPPFELHRLSSTV